MKYRVEELEGALLDAAVAKAQGFDGDPNVLHDDYSTDWAQGGPLISEAIISLDPYPYERGPSLQLGWLAAVAPHGLTRTQYAGGQAPRQWFGETPLVAAMRAFVASKLGEEVELP